ncbi:MAG TPA: PEP-CTERM sorting domain-containing protein [Verrucomicrobiae bacterium]|nr:PEP-CTERM sorting domain-containing protein [Verrucomicrobiae bacterium]
MSTQNGDTRHPNIDDLELTVVPEPASLSLCGLGLAAGWMVLRRRRA